MYVLTDTEVAKAWFASTTSGLQIFHSKCPQTAKPATTNPI